MSPHERVDPARTTSVYVHFPYCVERCRYCDFNVARKAQVPREAYTQAVLAEGALRVAPYTHRALQSLYFGGGTPSLWGASGVGQVIAAVKAWFPLAAPDLEVTLEANPLEGALETLAAYRAVGVTRLSLGVQSLSDERLAVLNRGHGRDQALLALKNALSVGFDSVSADLIFGLPGQTHADFEGDLRQLLDLGVPHLSVYQLTLEPKTGLAVQAARGLLTLPDEDTTDAQWDTLGATIASYGLVTYETSSHGRPGHWSRHNSGYWLGQPYLGLGAGAHSLLLPERGWGHAERRENVRPHRAYLDAAGAGRDPMGTHELLSARAHTFERLFTGLRYAPGIDLEALEAQQGRALVAPYRATLEALRRDGLLVWSDGAGLGPGGRVALTERGRSVSDSVFERLAAAYQRADADQEPPIFRRDTVPV